MCADLLIYFKEVKAIKPIVFYLIENTLIYINQGPINFRTILKQLNVDNLDCPCRRWLKIISSFKDKTAV